MSGYREVARDSGYMEPDDYEDLLDREIEGLPEPRTCGRCGRVYTLTTEEGRDRDGYIVCWKCADDDLAADELRAALTLAVVALRDAGATHAADLLVAHAAEIARTFEPGLVAFRRSDGSQGYVGYLTDSQLGRIGVLAATMSREDGDGRTGR